MTQQARDLQEALHREWTHLMQQALYSLRDYFQDGGDGSLIPKSYRVKVDAYSGRLNNFSAQFYREHP